MDGTGTGEGGRGSSRERFEMHPRLLWDVITMQAGSIEKSLLEGIMNSIDAGASGIAVGVDEGRISIVDDGRGFADRSEVDRFFKVFGQPHGDGDAVYGRFRMGRGQLFAFGRNVWRSRLFRMTVDLDPAADPGDEVLGFDLEETAEDHPGCAISVELRDPLRGNSVEHVVRNLARAVRHAPVAVSINGTLVTRDDEAWDHEDDDVRVALRDGSVLSVYNLGILVCDIPSRRIGIAGTLVSKRRLKVNFARNQVMDDCAVWRRTGPVLKNLADRARKGRARLTDMDREALAEAMATGDVPPYRFMKAKAFTDVQGTHHHLDGLLGLARKRFSHWELGGRTGERAHESGSAFVFADATLDRFGARGTTDLLEIVRDGLKASESTASKETGGDGRYPWSDALTRTERLAETAEHVAPEALALEYDGEAEEVPPEGLSRKERGIVEGLQAAADVIHRMLSKPGDQLRARMPHDVAANPPRLVRVGRSRKASAWTDGTSRIWIEEGEVCGEAAYTWCERHAALSGLLLHEYMHGGPDGDSHVHDEAFYRLMHDILIDTKVIDMAAKAFRDRIAEVSRKDPAGTTVRAQRRARRAEDLALAGFAGGTAAADGEETAPRPVPRGGRAPASRGDGRP